MVTMPGTPVEEAWSPEGEGDRARIANAKMPADYKPEMGIQGAPAENPYKPFTADTDRAQMLTQQDPGWQERFVQHFRNAQQYGTPGVYELTQIRDAENGYVNGQAVGKEAGVLSADQIRQERADRQMAYEGMKPADSFGDYVAAVGGEVAGAVADPASLLQAPVKIGSVGWRAAWPMLSRMLDSSVSNAAMNVAINGVVQAEEAGAGLRDQVDWLSLGIDAGAGAAFGLPFGALEGRAAAREASTAVPPPATPKGATEFYAAEAQAPAPQAPAPQPAEPVPPVQGLEVPTAAQLQAEHPAADLAAAQESLFGEVVGTRNLTPEQAVQLDDYLNGGRAGDIPQAPPETQGGLTNDVPPPAAETSAPAAPPPAPLPIDRTERQFSPSELKVDAKRFQFKDGGDEAGVTDRLKGVKRWDPIKSGVTLVWEDLKGDFYIADGHQRHGLASRLEAEGQDPKIRAVVLREADGVSAEDARSIAAAKNIAEGTGNAIDAAKILRSRPDMGVDLPPTSALVRDAQGLANLSDDAFGMVVNKKVTPGYAAQVGRLAPDPKTHAQLLELLAKEQPDNAIEAESMIRDALDAPAVQSTMEDMFGSAEVTQILFKERAQVLSAAATAIRKDRAAFTTLVKEEARLTGAGNQLATATNAERATHDAEILATLQAQARRKGPVADALAAAAQRLHAGEPRAAVVRGFLDELRRSSAPVGPNGRGAGAPGRAGEAVAARLEPTAGPEYPLAPRSEWYGDANFEQTGGRIGYMTPDQFLAQVRPLEIDEVARENIDMLKQHILEGKTLDPLAIYKSGKEDGRHRAIAAKELGIAEVPVLTWDSGIAFSRRPASTGPGLFDNQPAPPRNETALQRNERQLKERTVRFASGMSRANDFEAGGRVFGGIENRGIGMDVNEISDAALPRIAQGVLDWQTKLFVDSGAFGLFRRNMREQERYRAEVSDLFRSENAAPPEIKDMDFRAVLDRYEAIQDAIRAANEVEEAYPKPVFVAPDVIGDQGASLRLLEEHASELRQFGENLIVPIQKGERTMAEAYLEAKRILGSDFIAGVPSNEKAITPDEFRAFVRDAKPDRIHFLGAVADAKLEGRFKILAEEGLDPAHVSADGNILRSALYGKPAEGATRGEQIKNVMKEDPAFQAQVAADVERGADNRPQLVIPGAGRITDKKLAEMRAAAPLRSTRSQKPMDTGLFSSEADQQGFAFSAPQHPLNVQVDVKRAFFGSQPERPLEELYASGILEARQTELADVGQQIADELGIKFVDPGVKELETTQEKIGRKGYTSTAQLVDLVRGGFMVTRPEQADALVSRLADHFSILDEGWFVTPHGYFDRKVGVRFYDGTIGEIQVWEPQLFDAKKNRGGSDLYTQSRSMPLGPERDAVEQQMLDLYGPINQALPPEWADAVGKGGSSPKLVEKASRRDASSGNTLPDSPTSMESTGTQGSPGAKMANALPTDQSAGRASQSTNLNTETSLQGKPGDENGAAQADNLSQGTAFARRPQQGTMPANRPQAGTVTQANLPAAPRLEDISADLAQLTGAPVRQGRLQRAPKGGGKVAGQYDRGQGVIRLREMSDFETQTHETAHSLETEWGRSLNTIKLAHTAELEPLAYSGADPRQQLSEGFAEWFRYYVTTPNYARSQAPGFTQAFEELLRQRDPKQLAGIQRIAQAYQAHVTAPSRSAVRGDVVSTRSGGAVSDFLKESRKEGIRATLAGYASTAYTTLVDKLNPISKAVDELAKIYEKRTGQALDLKAAQDPYRMARLLQDSYSAGHMDLVHGVVPYHGVTPEGPGLSDALAVALGDTWMGWDDELAADFASYMISRRAVREYDRYLAGEIPNPPGKFTKGDYQVTIAELEAQHPRWAQAADMVYEWQRNMLRKKYEAGFIPQDLYDELLQRPDYVPFMRDLTDLDREVSADANRTLRNSIIKAFKGSKRSIINPIESMMTDAYHTAALIRRNDVFKALEDLARTAGPGAGAIAERIPSTQLTGSKINVSDVLKAAGKEAGLNPGDVDSLTSLVDSLLGDNATGTIFRAGDINEKGEPIVYVWRDGKKHALRLADGDFGRELYDAMTGMNKEARDLFTAVLSVPSTVLRYSITTSPPFVLANYIRDQISAWVLSGERFIPFVTGALGLRDEIMQREITQIYNTFGGIMGGANVAALDKGRVKRDLRALAKKGYAVKRFAGLNGFAQFTELTETGTRLGIFKAAMERGRKQGLSDYEAAVEAAFQARDYIDFGRHGSRTHAARRLVTFLNASVQGLDKTFRVLTGEGAVRKAITPFINQKAGRPLSARDKANLGRSAKAWAGLTAVGVFGLGLTALYRDDPEYEEISDYLRATHWMVKKGPGEWYAIPKPFELGFVSNLFERGFEAVYKRNPVAMESFWSGLFDITAPPATVPIFDVSYQLAHNVDSFGRPIVGPDIAGLEPWRQYNAQTSEIAKAMGYATDTSPAMIDHAIQGFGASWGKIITDISRDKGQERSTADIAAGALTRRFIKQETSGSVSSKAFWDQMSESSGPLTQAANTYKDLLDTQGPAAADAFLETKDENTKAYALLTGNFKAAEERLHPMRRAKDAISAISALRRELASNRVTAVESKNEEDPEILTFTPDQRQGAQELLARLAMVEARNALITTGITGFAQKDYMDAESLRKDIAELAPQLGEELNARYEKKHVYDDLYVREVWPDVKNRLLEDRQDADLSDLTAGAE